jgi:hypothetical protein
VKRRILIVAAAGLSIGACSESPRDQPVNRLPHLDTQHDVPAPLGVGGEAEWMSRPSSVAEAAREADTGVIATVVRVVRGPPLVAAPDEINETRIVTLEVKDRWFGDIPSQFTVNWLAGTLGDPPYAVGQDYVLLLTPRKDGPWYRPASPDGRIQILNNRLRPLIEGEMAAQVATLTVTQAKQAAVEGRS